jgi:glycosyltransferase involved in cell wall biosynthesis
MVPAIGKQVKSSEAIAIIAPGAVGIIATWFCILLRRPYALEVISDPYDMFSPGSIKHPLRPLIRFVMPLLLRLQCKKAAGVLYVTRYALQRRYPPNKNALTFGVSDIKLADDAYCPVPKKNPQTRKSFTIVSTGILEQLFKAPDILMKAIQKVRDKGFDVNLIWIGGGKYLQNMKQMAEQLGISEHVNFVGQVTAGAEVRRYLDMADIFVMPSLVEGLPRAMIEAMARGLPCVGTRVGGIPELLPPEALVEPRSVDDLAEKILSLMQNPDQLNQMAARNLEFSYQYHQNKLNQTRLEFYEAIKTVTQSSNAKATKT